MLDTFGELMVLLNCFYMSFYLSRVMIVVIPLTEGGSGWHMWCK